MELFDSRTAFGCGCASCSAGLTTHFAPITTSQDGSLDPDAGGTYRDKPIWDVPTIEENLNRSGYDWYTNNYGELDDGVLNFGFWTKGKLLESYYVSTDGTIAFNEAYYSDDFSKFSTDQMALATRSIGMWDELIDIELRQSGVENADITFGNTFTGGAQAYAYLPFGDEIDELYEDLYGFEEVGRLGGDIWIDGFVASNFFPLTDSYYATTTMIHELGHSLGLSHPGDYNATDDNDGDGVPDPITYDGDAFFAQDSLQYSIMSYFDGYETGAQFIDFDLLNFAYPSTPMIHDIATIQEMYGVDMTTRADDTVYGFNSTEALSPYDFTANTRPVLSIWDGGGNDTLDLSGYDTGSVIDLNAGGFSSAGGADSFATLEEINANRALLGFAPRTQATYDYYQDLIARLNITDPGFKDNISIAYGATIENAIGGSGNDTILANEVANVIVGNGGTDTVSYETATSGVIISLQGKAGKGGALGDTISLVENLRGSSFNDQLYGNNLDNVLNGGNGNDRLRGGAGTDSFVFRANGKAGNDIIADFSVDDVIAVDRKIPDGGDLDNIINVSADGTVVFDTSDGDSVRFLGTLAQDGLKLLGASKGLYYYASVNSDLTLDDVSSLGPVVISKAEQAEFAAAAPRHDTITVDLANRVEGYAEQGKAPTSGTSGLFGGDVAAPTTGLAGLGGGVFGADSHGVASMSFTSSMQFDHLVNVALF